LILPLLPISASATEQGIQVEVTGHLRTGLVAIGGETTGTTITAKGITWELEFGKDSALHKKAEKLGNQTVLVRGSLERRAGVEISERWIVTVTSLEPAGGKPSPELEAKARQPDTRIGVIGSEDNVILEISSPRGIDSATITRRSENWPKSMIVRLNLRGLESFKVENGKLAVEWSVSSTGEERSRVSLRQDGKELPIGEDSRYFSEVKAGGNRFTVPLPASLFEGNPKQITLRWIDFYR
jgi:hypothetical protein